MTRATRDHEPLVVAFVDVDQMKAINDAGGRSAGDRLLRHVARTLQSSFRPCDLLVRHGGDEVVRARQQSLCHARTRRVGSERRQRAWDDRGVP